MTWLTRHAKLLLAIYLVLLAIALFSPSSGTQSGMVYWVQVRLWHLGFSHSLVTFPRMEVIMNAVIVAPASFLGSLWRPHYTWRDWTALAFVASVIVEAVQGLLLSGRQASLSDIVANTAGALLGITVLVSIRLSRRMTRC